MQSDVGPGHGTCPARINRSAWSSQPYADMESSARNSCEGQRPPHVPVIVDHNTANTKGEVIYLQRLTGEYTRGLPGGDAMWTNVTQVNAAATASFDAPQKGAFMEGFPYRNDLVTTMNPDFFKGFPPL